MKKSTPLVILSTILMFVAHSQDLDKTNLERVMEEPWFINGTKHYADNLNFMVKPSQTFDDLKNAELIDDLKIIIESNFLQLLDYENRQISHIFLQRRKVAAKLAYNRREAIRYISQSSLEYKETVINILRKNLGYLDVAQDNRYVYDANIHELVIEASTVIDQNFRNLEGAVNSTFNKAESDLKGLKIAYKFKRRSKVFYLREPADYQTDVSTRGSK